MADDVGFQRGGPPAAAAQGGFNGWVHEKPWHFWVTVIIGLLGVYLAYRAFRSYNAGGATGAASGGSVLGSSGGVLDPGGATGGTSSVGTTTPDTAKPFWSSFLGANPLSASTDPHFFDVGESQAAQLTTLQQIAAAFHLRGGVTDLTNNPNNAGLKNYNPTKTLPVGTQVWVTTSTIDPNAPNHLG
jgi:hypothetical protein